MTAYPFDPPVPISVEIAGTDKRFPVNRVFCVGRNYAAHAREMGKDPDREPPFFFQKNPNNLDASGDFPYPAQTSDVHHEIEMVVALKSGGTNIPVNRALDHVFGYGIANQAYVLWMREIGVDEELVLLNDAAFGLIFAGVAGIMVFISLDELLPAAETYGKHHYCIYGVITGMAVMALSMLLLGE